jgi:hypothetical protein
MNNTAGSKEIHKWEPVTEPASPEECALIEEGMEEYRKNPASFVPLKDIK